MKKIFTALVCAACVAGVFWAFTAVRSDLNADELHKLAESTKGLSARDARKKLGAPDKVVTFEDYTDSERDKIDKSYNPSPPLVPCQQVLVYLKNLRIVLLYVDKGKVVEVYAGLT